MASVTMWKTRSCFVFVFRERERETETETETDRDRQTETEIEREREDDDDDDKYLMEDDISVHKKKVTTDWRDCARDQFIYDPSDPHKQRVSDQKMGVSRVLETNLQTSANNIFATLPRVFLETSQHFTHLC